VARDVTTEADRDIDPHEIEDGWFEIILPSLQMRVTERVPRAEPQRAEVTLDRLRLRDDERIVRWRQSWYEMYTNGHLTLEGLDRVAPLIAAEAYAGSASASAGRA